MAASSPLSESLLTLAWSLWTELGVSGVERHHEDCAVDPEALLLFTAGLTDLDPRLREESLDCALAIGPFLSISRLKNLMSSASEASRRQFAPYAATFNSVAPSGLRLPEPEKAEALPFHPRGKSQARDLRAPGRVVLRLRATFGVGARADVLAAMLAAPARHWIATELARRVSFTKRLVSGVLEDLSRAGVVSRAEDGNRLLYRLDGAKGLKLLAEPYPRRSPPWPPILAFLSRMLEISAAVGRRSEIALAVDAQRVIEAGVKELGIWGVSVRAPEASTWNELLGWAERHAREIAEGESAWLGA